MRVETKRETIHHVQGSDLLNRIETMYGRRPDLHLEGPFDFEVGGDMTGGREAAIRRFAETGWCNASFFGTVLNALVQQGGMPKGRYRVHFGKEPPVRHMSLFDLVMAVGDEGGTVQVTVDNDEVTAHDEDGNSVYTARLDPQRALVELLRDLGVKARTA